MERGQAAPLGGQARLLGHDGDHALDGGDAAREVEHRDRVGEKPTHQRCPMFVQFHRD